MRCNSLVQATIKKTGLCGNIGTINMSFNCNNKTKSKVPLPQFMATGKARLCFLLKVNKIFWSDEGHGFTSNESLFELYRHQLAYKMIVD